MTAAALRPAALSLYGSREVVTYVEHGDAPSFERCADRVAHLALMVASLVRELEDLHGVAFRLQLVAALADS